MAYGGHRQLANFAPKCATRGAVDLRDLFEARLELNKKIKQCPMGSSI